MKMCFHLKAISPLIAVVLLIGFTIAVGTMIADWLIDYIRISPSQSEEKSMEKIKCAFGSLKIVSAKYNNTATKLSVLLRNEAGDTNLMNISFSVVVNDTVYTYPATCNCDDEILHAKEEKVYSNSSIIDGCHIQLLRVITNCEDAHDSVTRDKIDFYGC
jgi:flagellin-like protein